MSERSPGTQDLDAQLAEIDRRLREIQADLLPERETPSSRPPAPPQPQPAETAPPQPAETAPPQPQPLETAPPEPTSQPPETERQRRGREGPLATILQRSRAGPKPREAPAEHHPEPPPPRRAEPVDQLAALTGLHVKLLSSMRDLLDAYQWVLTQVPPVDPVASQPDPHGVALSAAPFTSTEAVRAFERALADIPGVLEVAVRGYEGEDRAIFDVHLSEPTA